MQSSLAALQDLIKVAAPAVTTIFVILQYRLNRRNAISQVYQERKRVYSGCYRVALSVMDDFADPCHEKILNEVN
jgi:hypothetical protein